MKNHPSLFLFFVFVFLLLFISWGKTESESFPYVLSTRIYEIPAAFTGQFSGITNETVRKSILHGFYELPFAKTGLVECIRSDDIVSLTVPLESHFLPEITNQPIRNVTIRFQEPSGEFLPSTNYLYGTESLLAGRCREKLHHFSQWNTNAPQCYWMAPMENFGGLAKLSFHGLPNGSNESVPVGTNGWGIAFWVDLDSIAILNWEAIHPPDDLDDR
jgi:hypothetical protein